VGRFVAGFLTASVLWGGAGAYAYYAGLLEPEAPLAVASVSKDLVDDGEAEADDAPSSMRRRRRRGRRAASSSRTPTGNATSGDDLGENDPREIAAGESGGEQQLSGAQVEAGFDQQFGRIRRCLVLIPGDAEVSGRVTFGLRIAGSGRVERVNLSGPRAVTTGEAGSCLRGAARAIRFDSFDGPDMVVRYPITLE